MYIIYALIDPRYYTIKYIGITRTGYARFIQHLSKDGKNHRKNGWIQELEDGGEMVLFEILDKAEALEMARQKEAFWIQQYREQLFNRSFPVSLLPDVTDYSPAHIQFFSRKDWLRTNMEWLQDQIEVLRIDFHINGFALHETLASYHFYLSSNEAYVYAVTRWAKRAYSSRRFVGYRFKLKNADWTIFGDREKIKACEHEQMQWVRIMRKPGTEEYYFPVYVPIYDENKRVQVKESHPHTLADIQL